MAEKYPFLSDDWVAAAKKIREDLGDAAAPPHKMRMNLIITEVPFTEGSVDAHMDTTEGMELDLGHLETPDLTVTLDWTTAKAILVEGNPQAGMQAFMAGKIKVQGDMTKLMAMQSAAPTPEAAQLQKALLDITE